MWVDRTAAPIGVNAVWSIESNLALGQGDILGFEVAGEALFFSACITEMRLARVQEIAGEAGLHTQFIFKEKPVLSFVAGL